MKNNASDEGLYKLAYGITPFSGNVHKNIK